MKTAEGAQVTGWRVGALLRFASSDDGFPVRCFLSEPVLRRGCPNALSPLGRQAQLRHQEELLGPDYGTTNGLYLGRPVL